MNSRKIKSSFIFAIIIFFLLGVVVGMVIGTTLTLSWGVETAMKILNISEEEIGLSKERLLDYVLQYQGRI